MPRWSASRHAALPRRISTWPNASSSLQQGSKSCIAWAPVVSALVKCLEPTKDYSSAVALSAWIHTHKCHVAIYKKLEIDGHQSLNDGLIVGGKNIWFINVREEESITITESDKLALGIVIRPEHHLRSVKYKYIKACSEIGLPTAAYHTLSNSIEREGNQLFGILPELDFERRFEMKEAACMRCDFAEPCKCLVPQV